MSDTPKFEVIDRRRMKAAEEQEQKQTETPAVPTEAKPETPSTEPAPGPRLVVNEGHNEPDTTAADEAQMPPAPTEAESREQKMAYDASAQRIEELIRAQNPGVGAQPALGFEHLIQQFYLSAMMQMGAGTQEGQRPRVDILGARNTIDLLGILAEKTRGNLNEQENRMLETALFDVRMAFLEISHMVNMQAMKTPPPPPPVK
jgi:hypothetical protein